MNKRGFTLIELLVVIAIIGILAVLVLANLRTAQAKARDSRRKSDLRNMQSALELYYNDNEAYPDPDSGEIDNAVLGNSGKYMSTVPADPLSHHNYGYIVLTVSGRNLAFELTASGENGADPELKGGLFYRCGGDYSSVAAASPWTNC